LNKKYSYPTFPYKNITFQNKPFMVPSLSFVASSFHKFNATVFSSALPEPKFTLTKARTFQGKLVYRRKNTLGGEKCYDFEIRVSTLFDLGLQEWEDVVIHEMIHLYIAFSGLCDSSSHGPVFRKIMADVNRRYGRNITVSGHATDEQRGADRQVRAHYLCVAKFSDGCLAVAPVAKSRIFELWDAFGCFPGLASMKWIGSVDPWFNRFPRVMKPKLYATSEEELRPHLKGGVLLERADRVIRPVSRRCYPDELLP
jgi:hypothetical protein